MTNKLGLVVDSVKSGLSAILILASLTFLPSSIASEKNVKGGFIDFNLYPYMSDVDNDNVIAFKVGTKFNDGWSYFSLTNIYNQSAENEFKDVDEFYTEQNIRWRWSDESPIDLTLQMNFRSGVDNDRHRLGFLWRLNDTDALSNFFNFIHMKYAINFHLIQIDHEPGNVWQAEHVFSLKFPSISEKLYLSGFIDHTFNQTLTDQFPNNPIVGAAQLGYEFTNNLFVVAEYRINQYRRSDVNNLAIGIEFLGRW